MTSGSMSMVVVSLAVFLVAALIVVVFALLVLRWGTIARRAQRQLTEIGVALLESEASAQEVDQALDAMDTWWLQLDAQGLIRAANNPTGMEVLRSEEVVGRPAADLIPDTQTADTFNSQFERCQEQQRVLAFEFVDERGRNVLARVSPVESGAIMVIRDLTAQRQRQDLLQESQERFALAAQGANDGIWDWDLVTGGIYWSWTFRKIVGDDELASTRDAWFARVHSDDLEGLKSALEEHLDGTDGHNHFSHEHRVDRGGTWSWVLARAQAVRDAAGRPLRLAGSLTDLTNRRVVQVTAEKAQLLEHATSAVDIGIGVALPTGGIDNPSATLLQMASPWGPELWWDLVRDRQPQNAATCPKCGLGQHIGTVRVPLIEPDGTQRVHEISWTGHAHEVFAEAGAHVIMVRDVTRSALAERRLVELNLELEAARDIALEANRLKSAFLANMSHELRTPLNHVIGYAEMLEEELTSLEEADMLDDTRRILSASRSLATTVGRLLDLSRIEAEQVELNTTSVSLRTLLFEVGAAQPGVTLTLELSDDLPETIETDPPKLKLLLGELVDNAHKFSQGAGVTLRATKSDTGLVIDVVDVGIGMAQGVQERLFLGYYQADTSTTRRYDGTGLGLLLAHRLASLLDAQLVVSSVEGRGTTISVCLLAGG